MFNVKSLTENHAPPGSSTAKEWIRPYYLKWFYSRIFADRYPPEFGRCWTYPGHGLDLDFQDWITPPGERSDIVFLPAADWHLRLQRSQHLATELVRRGHRCFYLNPHLGREFPNPYPLSRHVVLSRLAPNVFELHVHLPREPVYHHRPLMVPETQLVVSALERCVNYARSVDPVIVVSLPLWTPVARMLQSKWRYRVIYDCHDLWSGFGRFHPGILAAESDLFALSDAVCFSSASLMEAKTSAHPHTRSKPVLIRNAVRAEDFDFVYRKRENRRKVVAYAGALDFWFDVETVRFAAQRHPEWDFRLFGRIESDRVRELGHLPNIQLMGEVPYSSLRQHFASVDVCMIPFLMSPLTLATNPLKLYEYLACGLPVVSAPLPEVREFGELVYIASKPNEFVAQLEAAMDENSASKAEMRRRRAEAESWASRCSLLSAHFETRTEERPTVMSC